MTTRRTRSSVQRKLDFGNPSDAAVIHDDDDEKIEEEKEEEIDDGVAATTSKKKTAGRKGPGFLAGTSPNAKRRKKEKSSSSSSPRDAATAAVSQKTPSRPTITQEKSAVVTPPDEATIKKEKKTQKKKQKTTPTEYVPTYIHKNVEYDRLGQRRAADHNNAVHQTVYACYHWIDEHCDIPADLEQNRRYGPLSGTCYEERAVRAYRLGLIVPKRGDDAPQLCTSCGKLGHAYDECPSMV
jgi:hypothetical protein